YSLLPREMERESELILGRQPIVDTAGSLVAFELLFRQSGDGPAAERPDDLHASSHVIARVLADIGVTASLGRSTGYVNADRAVRMSGMVEARAPGGLVLVGRDATAIAVALGEGSLALGARGYRFALDDAASDDAAGLQRLARVDIVKIDVVSEPSQWMDR